MEEIIVVGIHPHDRMNEYTMPGYGDYGRFLVERLKPLIDGKYRTLKGPTIQLPWDLRWAVLFPFILAGNGRRCSAKSLASRARSRIGTICSIAFPRNQNENFRFISTAAGRATTTKLLAACEIVLFGKDIVQAPSSFTWLFQKRNTTRVHGLHAVRSHSSSFSETCLGSQAPDDPRSRTPKYCAAIYRRDSRAASENIPASCLEAIRFWQGWSEISPSLPGL